jgi:hypothetical protein
MESMIGYLDEVSDFYKMNLGEGKYGLILVTEEELNQIKDDTNYISKEMYLDELNDNVVQTTVSGSYKNIYIALEVK